MINSLVHFILKYAGIILANFHGAVYIQSQSSFQLKLNAYLVIHSEYIDANALFDPRLVNFCFLNKVFY